MTFPRSAPLDGSASPDGAAPPPSVETNRATVAAGADSPAADPRWAKPALVVLLLATAAFYLTNLTANGYANAFYSAAAQAGSVSWKAFFFGSFDAANAITVDKPPASLWPIALSVRLFGLNSFAILAPEVLMGVGSVAVVYASVRRLVGAAGGLIAGAALALTPVAALMFRFNNPEALLVLLMTLAAWACLRGIERPSARWMIWAGVFLGFGFLTKTLQVLLIVPGLALAYLVAADTTLRRRVRHLLIAAGAMIVSAGWWVAIVELMPAEDRPYIGGSQTNSFLELTFGYNGLGRLNGEETGSVGGGPGRGWGATGWLRMFGTDIGGQIAWLLPAALLLLVAGLVARGRAGRTDLRRAGYLVWGGWLVVTALVFSFMSGIFHQYYTVALAPAIAALVGIGAVDLWRLGRRGSAWARIVLAVVVAGTAIWSAILLARVGWLPWLRMTVLVLGAAAAIGLLWTGRAPRRLLAPVAGAALAASLLAPAAYSVATVSKAYAGSIVVAGPTSAGSGMGAPPANGVGRIPGGTPPGGVFPGGAAPGGGLPGGTAPDGTQGGARDGRQNGQNGQADGQPGGMGGLLQASTPTTELVAALSTDADRYTWVAAAVGSQNAAGLQLGTQLPVMSIGGFNGSDPSPTLAQFQQYVAQGRIHYFVGGGGLGGRSNGGSNTAAQIAAWVAANYTATTVGGMTLYDLTAPLSGSAASSVSGGLA